MANTCISIYEQARAAGHGGEDMSAVIKVWEDLTGAKITGTGK